MGRPVQGRVWKQARSLWGPGPTLAFWGVLETFLRTGGDRIRLGKNKSKTRPSNKIKYWGLIPQMRDEHQMEQIRILAENHWESEMPRNVYGPWGTKVSVKEWGSKLSWGRSQR